MTTLKDGLHRSLPMAEYLALPGISSHDLKAAAESMAHYRWRRDNPEPETRAFQIGRAFHWAVLEPDIFAARVVLSPYEAFRTNEAKEWRDAEQKKGNVIVAKEEHGSLCAMRQSLREHPSFAKVFDATDYELSAIASHSQTGLSLRCRFDWLPRGNFLGDIKTVAGSARADAFGREAWSYRYIHQFAHYLRVWNILHPDDQRREFLVAVVEKEPPHCCAIHAIPSDALSFASKENNALLYRIAECERAGHWPGHPGTIDYLRMPDWVQRTIDQAA